MKSKYFELMSLIVNDMKYETHFGWHFSSKPHLQEEVCSILHKEMGSSSSTRECKGISYYEYPFPLAWTVALSYLSNRVID